MVAWMRARRLALAAVAITLAVPLPALAQGPGDFFAALFGGLVRPRPLPPLFGGPAPGMERPAAPRVAYCVRLCDGRYFPLSSLKDADETCSAFCPKAETRVYRGAGAIDTSEHEGEPYTALPNAFVFRARLDKSCTCTGDGPLGLAPIPIKQDETLRPGDVVMTGEGARVFQKGKPPYTQASFVPAEEARRLPADLRRRIEELRLAAEGGGQAEGNSR